MKRAILVFVLLFCLLLGACGTQEPTTPSPITQTYAALDRSLQADTAVATVLYNGLPDGLSATHILNDTPSADKVYIVPRFTACQITVSMIRAVGTDGWEIIERTRMTVNAKENTLLQLSLSDSYQINRMWYMEVLLPDGTVYSSPIPFVCENATRSPVHVGADWDGKERLLDDWGREEIVETLKPVLYLYPQEECQVDVKLDYAGELTCTYPKYEEGWSVTACPDGTLTDDRGQEYNYLYWEGVGYNDFDFSRGFCVTGEDTAAFLEEALEKLGLTRREANEFIVYWLPLMEGNPYNVISFQTDTYEEAAQLTVTPEPDTVIRVFMAWYGTDHPVELPAQELTAPSRQGFILVEWGGSRAVVP